MTPKIRLYQFLRQRGIINTREEAKALARSSQIKINGRIVPLLHFQFDPHKDIVVVNQKKITSGRVPLRYYLLHKPVGFVASKKRDRAKPHVMELFHEEQELMHSLFPVGRLDFNTSGLLIVTNEGTFAKKILDPAKHIEKEYWVEVESQLTVEDLANIEHGFMVSVDNEKYTTLPAQIKIMKKNKHSTVYSLILREGKKRQIRLMMSTLGHPVLSLHRVRIGKLALGDLPAGKYKEIKPIDVF